MRFGVLGRFEAYDRNGAAAVAGARKPTILLTALLLHPNAWIGVNQLVDVIWQEQDTPASAEQNLKTYIWQLRRTLTGLHGGHRIESRPGAYRIRVESGDLDIGVAENLETAADHARVDGDAAGAVTCLTEALLLWRGEPYEGLPDELTASAVSRADQLRRRLREKLADGYACQGRYDVAARLLQVLTEEDPLHEGSWARLVRALHRSGQRSEALAAYQRARAVLSAELGVEPGPELVAAHRSALDTGLTRRDLPRTVADFLGREPELNRIRAVLGGKTTAVPVLVLDGMPGAGKTALAVHAAHEVADAYPDGQLFVDLHAGLPPSTVLARLLRAAGAPVPTDPDEREAVWRGELAGRRLLLVLDDAADAAQVRPLLPGTPGCAVVITTRNRGLWLAGATALTTEPLPVHYARQLFPGAPGEVFTHCGGLPAAIRAVSAMLRNRPLWTIDALTAELATLFEPAFRALSAIESRVLALGTSHIQVDAAVTAELTDLEVPVAQEVLDSLFGRHLMTQPSPGRYSWHIVVRDQVKRQALIGAAR
ncbi:DNA-binding transcriptional activator of the SARP family [Amycolatopsis xylanica]|uniref:DNA-binding transcriptional activator of the SARP family n=1 Tax=Amycolatopsis xylanica TaxID=589385 RepID=A0A1H2S1W8_9PSEU|nr:BTAD domain-containing putative transcriptional regulator [Amycolatopsis xylanica]SDW25627.1 DNA-binding transcriptional activator of the SARP family [Amycolatopsis xylanica]